MRKSFVRFRHPVSVFLLFNSSTAVVGGIHESGGEFSIGRRRCESANRRSQIDIEQLLPQLIGEESGSAMIPEVACSGKPAEVKIR
jgi:hypothetical protein